MNYRVLWIDDEYQTQKDFIGFAEQEGIDIIPFESHEEGMKELNKRMNSYHAVILDAKVKEGKNDKVANLKGLKASRDQLIEINKDLYLPFFIFTGQPDYIDSGLFRESYGDFFIKGKDNDLLLQSIKEAVEKKEEYFIKKKYKRSFDVCTDQYIGQNVENMLFIALRQIEVQDTYDQTKDLFTGLRKIVETLFKRLNELGLLPNEIYNSKGWINQSSYFLSGTHQKFRIKSDLIHPTTAFLIKNVLQITQDASHENPEKLRLRVSQYIGDTPMSYLYNSVVFQLLDIIIWFKMFVDENPDKEKNMTLWEESSSEDWIMGSVIRIADNGYGTFMPASGGATLSIIPAKVKESDLNEGDIISVTTKPDPSGTKEYIQEIRK